MRVDLHTHTWYSPDGMLSPQRLVRLAKARGLDAIAVTDHNRLTKVRTDRLIVISGEEIRALEGEIIGLFLEEEIPRGLPAAEVFDRIREQGGIAVIPHPFDRFRKRTALLLRVTELPQDVLIEVFNARYVSRRFSEEAKKFAETHGFPQVGGSDAHTPVEVGRVWTEVPYFSDAEELYDHLRRGRTRPVGKLSPPWVHLTVPVIKSLHTLGLLPHRT